MENAITLEKKPGFLIYHDYRKLFEALDDKQLRSLLYSMFDYDRTGIKPDYSGDKLLEISTIMLFERMDRDREKYAKRSAANKKNGAKGGRPKKNKTDKNPMGNKKTQSVNKKPNGLNKNPNNPTKPKKPDIDKDIDKDIDIDKDKDIVLKGERKKKERETSRSSSSSLFPSLFTITEDVIDYFNKAAGTTFDHSNTEYICLIRDHLKRGHTPEQLKTVIDRKVKEWSDENNRNDMTVNINPLTVLNIRRFDSYLNGRPAEKDRKKKETMKALDENIEALSKELAGLDPEEIRKKSDRFMIVRSRLDKLKEQRQKLEEIKL